MNQITAKLASTFFTLGEMRSSSCTGFYVAKFVTVSP